MKTVEDLKRLREQLQTDNRIRHTAGTQIIVGMGTCGIAAGAREVLAAIKLDDIHSNGYSFQIEMTHTAWHLGFRIVESPITFEERREGQSKMSGGIINEALWMVWKLLARCGYRRRPAAVHPQSVAAGKAAE